MSTSHSIPGDAGRAARRLVPLAGLLLGLAAIPAGAQSIYRCDGPAGTTFSQFPCAGPGESMQRLEPVPAPHPDLDTLLRSLAAERDFDARMAARERSAAQAACIEAMTGATRRGTERRIAARRSRIAELHAGLARAAPGLRGLVWANGLRVDIASEEAGIGEERQILLQTELAARESCITAPAWSAARR